MNEPLTHAERLLWLAGLMVKCSCPECHGNPVVDSYVCQGKQLCCKGTGEVPRFPMLRQECSGAHSQIFDNIDSFYCDDCHGRGWVPVNNLEATLEAINSELMFDRSRRGWACLIRGHEWTEWCALPNEAAVLALYQAVKAEEDKP